MNHNIRAAEGWLELGDCQSACEELENMEPTERASFDVLELRWRIYATAKKWESAAEIGDALVKLQPNNSLGWIHRSYALHEIKRTQEAWDQLLPALEKFPKEFGISYNLACYACCLGRHDEARQWLDRASALGDKKAIQRMAIDDPDLQPLLKH
jgi:predicted Zn-dependent protease